MFDGSEVPGLLAMSGGVTVSLAGRDVCGVEDFNDLELEDEDAHLVGRLVSVHVPTCAVGDAVIGSRISFKGKDYTVRSMRAIDDGAVTKISCLLA